MHKTWEIFDSSKIQCFISCPRHYFYRYILGWTAEQTSIHLVFGEGWHRAMETLLKEGYTIQSVEKGYNIFLSYYRQFFTEIEDANNYPKSPNSIKPSLLEYIGKWGRQDEGQDVKYTEIAGTVPVNEKRVIHFRMDSVIDTPKGIISLEHKTGSRLTAGWYDQWMVKVQTGTYLHVLSSLYNPESVYGVIINGAIFRKGKNDYVRHPIRLHIDMMNVWLWEINHYIDMVEWNMYELSQTSESDKVMCAFPRNGEYCTKWGRTCEFHDFCTVWANPLQRCHEIPIGLRQEWWNPADKEEELPEESVIHVADFLQESQVDKQLTE